MKAVNCKVVMLGDTGVGKSCLVSKFVRDEFSEFQEPTIGAAYQVKNIKCKGNQKTVKFEIWDTAGQERYKSLTPMYYRGADIAMLCFDTTSKDSFDGAVSWEKELSTKGPANCIQILVGTKCDLK
ncbi:GTP-binding protein, partial [bacterium]|nr:GTP-binding protein [bacterium]